MIFQILRTYFPDGTNGRLLLGNTVVAHTIELPWLNNERNISCIPEGKYFMEKRYSDKHQWHLLIKDVPYRSEILIHPANNAKKELKGCIAPVSRLTGSGRGIKSKYALQCILDLAYSAEFLEEDIELWISR